MALIGVGFRSLSMAPASIGPVKTMLLELDAAKVRARLDAVLDGHEPEDRVQAELRAFAREEGVPL
jgi:phosphotransferase system enzyme I (PtsP)